METKICSKCGKEKSINEFYKHKTCKGGVRSQCKNCIAIGSRIYAINNPEKIKAKYKKWRENNPEKIKIVKSKYRIEHKEKINADSRKWYGNNKKRAKECNKQHRDNMADCYVKNILRLQGLTNKQINENPELIEIKRLIIKTKRLCKTLQN